MEIILIMGLADDHEVVVEEDSFSKVVVMYTDLTHSVDGLCSFLFAFAILLRHELGDRRVGVVRLAVTLGAFTSRDFKKLLIGVVLAHLFEDDVPLVGMSSLCLHLALKSS